jgi:succinate dehydrogenase hydrophobic anchor subunit
MRRPRWRLATWAMILWSAFIAAWIALWLLGDDCSEYRCDSPVSFWIAMLVGLWSIGFTLLFVWWVISGRRRRRD